MDPTDCPEPVPAGRSAEDVTVSVAGFGDGRLVVVELDGCLLVADVAGVVRDVSAAAAALYVAGVDETVDVVVDGPGDRVEVGAVTLNGPPDGCRAWVVDPAAAVSWPVEAAVLVERVAAGVARWLASGAGAGGVDGPGGHGDRYEPT